LAAIFGIPPAQFAVEGRKGHTYPRFCLAHCRSRQEKKMLEDLRNHDPRPTPEERAWMGTDPLHLAGHVIAAVAVALLVALSLSAPDGGATPPVVAASSK